MLLAGAEGSGERLARRGRRVWPPARGDVPSFGNLIHKDLAKSHLAVSKRRKATGEAGDETRRPALKMQSRTPCPGASQGTCLYHNFKESFRESSPGLKSP